MSTFHISLGNEKGIDPRLLEHSKTILKALNPIKGIMSLSIYSLGERTLRTAVFQIGVSKGFFEKCLISIYNICTQKTCFPKGFDPQRAELGLKSFINLGAEIEFVSPKDGKATIQMMRLRSIDLEHSLKKLGATWEKITLEGGNSIIAIIPPQSPTEQWNIFETELLKLKWKKQCISTSHHEKLEVIITCENADILDQESWHQNVFLHSNSASVSFVMLTRRAGFYLGCKQDICFYDPRGTWKSTGIASEAGYYNDIEAVYNQIKGDYDSQNIWITSACGGCCPAAYLKSKLHQFGVNLILENGFSDLRTDFVAQESWFARKFADYFWAGLKSKDIALQDKPIETGFNIHKLWNELHQTDIGKIVIVSAKNDQHLPSEVATRNVELAQSKNERVCHVRFQSMWKADPHFDRYFKYDKPTRKVLNFIFNS